MGIRLIVEVFDHWRDFGLTAGERDDLLVIAENANDQDRQTRGPLHEDYVLKRANKSAKAWKNAIAKLAKKGALEYTTSGRPGQHAVYRIAVLCHEAPHDGWKGHCTRPERVTPQVTHEGDSSRKEGHLSDDPLLGKGHPTGDPSPEMGHLSDANGSPDRCEWVTSQVTPTPPTPHNPQPPPSAAAAPPDEGEVGGGTEQQQPGPIARATALIDALDYRGKPPGRSARTTLCSLALRALRGGWSEHDLKAYLDLGQATVGSAVAVYRHRLSPSELPQPPAKPEPGPSLPPWCGQCADGNPAARDDASMRWIDAPDGTTQPCPRCSRQATRAAA